MTKASTHQSSLTVELSSRTSGWNAVMNSIARRARAAGSLGELVVGYARRGRPAQGPDDG